MRDLRDTTSKSGLVAVAAELLVESGRFESVGFMRDPVMLLDAVASEQVSSPWVWSQDRILPMNERQGVLGGEIVAAENQHCWEALLTEGSDFVEFVDEFRGWRGDEFVVAYERVGVSMPLAEFLVRVFVVEWILAPRRRRLRCHEVGSVSESYVLLPAASVARCGRFPRLLAGPGWVGFGEGRSMQISLQSGETPAPFGLGTSWSELVSQPATPEDVVSWDPWAHEKLENVDRWTRSTWETIVSPTESNETRRPPCPDR